MRTRNAIAWTAALLFCALPNLADGPEIADAKLLPDDSTVSLSAKVVTYASAGFFYIEEDSRCMGIRVEKSAHGLAVGMRADLTGALKTNTNRERYILATSAVQTAAPNANGSVAPVGVNNLALGGNDWKIAGTGGQKGTSLSVGLNNIGLLVKTWGQFHQVDATTFTVDDGTGCLIECTVPAGTFLHSGWQYVTVTGISSVLFSNSIYAPNILVRDIRVVSPVEAVSIPGTPSGNANPMIDVPVTYATSGSTCSQGHPVEYSFNWGDGTSSPWSASTSASHSWSVSGTKTVTVAARCQVNASVSASSSGLQINVTGSTYTGQMIFIAAGAFNMGTPDGYTASHNPDEHPQHSVSLAGYYIGKYEVTRGEYKQFMQAGGYSNSAYWSSAGWSWKVSRQRTAPSYWAANQDWGTGTFTQTDNHPVVGVTYHEAQAFCNWAGGHLPTEAQWEKAAGWNGTHLNVHPWGNAWDVENCNNWYDHNSAGGGYRRYQTAPVGSYPSGASPYGCQDMAGNLWEWCQDWYGSSYYSQTPAGGWSDPQGPANGVSRVLRGGCWSGDYESVNRCAYRSGYDPASGWTSFGFRLAR